VPLAGSVRGEAMSAALDHDEHDERILDLESRVLIIELRLALLEADTDRLAERLDRMSRRGRRWWR
jgi:hypothetical protein